MHFEDQVKIAKLMSHSIYFFFFLGGGSGQGGGWVGKGQGGLERRIEAFVKIQKKKEFEGGGGGSG